MERRRASLGEPEDVELVTYADPGRGGFRYASLVGSQLNACLFLARPAAALPSRDAVAALLGSDIIDESRARVLSGHLHRRDGIDNPGRTVCACFAVGLRTLLSAISKSGLTSIAEIGAALRAGSTTTACKSCAGCTTGAISPRRAAIWPLGSNAQANTPS
jgi:assimilatory nitrate reductase catalytic subunit